jgi:ABC-2 type transport system permease protein
MNTPSNPMHEFAPAAQAIPPTTMSATRPFYWSVRRELWENRYIYVAPLAVTVVMLFGYLIASIGRAMSVADPAQRVSVLTEPTDFAAVLIMGTAFVVGLFYSLDALHGERRDRSILFWKSLPVSDLTTVLSKASIPLVVLPLLSFVLTAATQLIMLLLSTAVLRGSGQSGAALDTHAGAPDVADAALPPRNRAYALVRANLRLDPPGLGLGAARGISVGRFALARDRHHRETCLQHFAFRCLGGLPHQW